MTQKWQIVLLSAVVSYGSGLVAMEKKPEPRNPLSHSIAEASEAIAIRSAANKLHCSAEFCKQEQLNKEAKEALKNSFFAHCGGNTPPEYFNNYHQKDITYFMKPFDPYYPGR